jgi:T5SS/PEP-CTERM-associated repeat protein
MRTLLAGTAICCLASSATAQSEAVWQGTNCSPRNWSNAQCWRDGILPDTTQPLSYRFAGNLRSIPYNDLGGKGTLSFESGLPSGFEIRGSSNFLLWDLSNTSGQNIKVSMPVTFESQSAFAIVDGGTGGVSFTGPVALGVSTPFARLTIDTSSAIGANTGLELIDGARATFADIAVSGAHTSPTLLRLSGQNVSLTSRSGVALTGIGVPSRGYSSTDQYVGVGQGAMLKGINGTIGGVAGSNNLVTVGGAGSRWISTGTLVIGSAAGGRATLALSGGGRASANEAEVGGIAKVGAITVNGVDSALDVANGLSIGGSGGQSTLNVSGGGRVSSTYLYVGNDSGSLGFGDLSGAGTNWQVGNSLFVGNNGGTGVITIYSGAALQAPTLSIGSGGTVRIDGGSLGVASLTREGAGVLDFKAGTLRLVGGGTGMAFGGGTLTLGVSSSLLLDGGSANLGSLAMSGGTLATTAPGSAAPPAGAPVGTDIALRGAGGAITNIGGIQGFGTVAAPLTGGSSSTIRASGGTLALGDAAAADGYAFAGRLEVATGARALLQSASPVALSGATWLENGAELVSVNGLSIGGDGGLGTLTVNAGGRVSSTSGYVGMVNGSRGSVDLSGAGASWQVDQALSVGMAGGTGVITIGSGAALQAPTLNIGNGGTVRIDGGSLDVSTLTRAGAGVFDWKAGTLRLMGGGSGVPFASGPLALGSARTLLLDGGSANFDALAMSGGTLATTAPGSAAPLAGAPVGTDIALRGAGGAITHIGGIQGFGTVAAPLYGGSSSTIRASGGTLALGDVAAADGYAFGGRLEVATGARALLQSASPVALSGATWLEAGATLASVNGLVQAAIAPSGLWLVYDRDATIEGRFINDGMVGAYTFGGWLTITGLLSGHGGQFYYGRTRLTAGIAAEHGSGRLGFGGGDLSFAAGSVLNLSIAGTPDSGLYDQLMGIGQLSFQGSLHLDFEPGFDLAPGGHYALLGFGSATGSLAAGDIVVTGLDARRVDASHLLIDGSIDVAAVPEPATTALWAAGLGMLGWGTRRARRAMRTRAY